MKEAIILCGGNGKRLRSITKDRIPKPLVQIQGKSILEHQIAWLRSCGVERIILAAGHLASRIKELFKNGSTEFPDLEIVISDENKTTATHQSPSDFPGFGTGGSLKIALEKTKSNSVILLYGDVMTNFNIIPMEFIHTHSFSLITMFLTPLRSRYGIVTERYGLVKSFEEKPLLPHLINGGVFIIDTSIRLSLPDVGPLETTLLPKLAKMDMLSAFKPEEKYQWISIETEKDYELANIMYAQNTER